MDDPSLETSAHHSALRGLERINFLSRTWDQIYHALSFFDQSKQGRLRILDIATGGGDIPLGLALKTQNQSLPFVIHGCDKSLAAIEYAQSKAKMRKAQVTFFQLDIDHEPIPEGYDVIMCSLFLHHLPIIQTRRFLKKIAAAAQQGIIINDLRRCWPGYLLAACVPFFLSRSSVVHEDGIQSVRAAYSFPEIKRVAASAGLKGAKIQKIWPFRYQIRWKKNEYK